MAMCEVCARPQCATAASDSDPDAFPAANRAEWEAYCVGSTHRYNEYMSTGAIVTAIVAALVAIGAIAMILDARRKRRAAERTQTHSNVKPQPLYDEQARIREGGLGIGEGPGGAGA